MKVVFLDVDGVLNSASYLDRSELTGGEDGRGRWWLSQLDRAAVRRLNSIVETTDARVVISSTWRYSFHYTQMQRLLTERGFVGEVVGSTPIGKFARPRRRDGSPLLLPYEAGRGYEIRQYMHENDGVDEYVILDDSDIAKGPAQRLDLSDLMDRFVQTTWEHGLLDEHVDKAVEILSTPRTGGQRT